MKKLSKKLLLLVLAMTMIITTVVTAPVIADAATAPQSIESTAINFWADAGNTITQADVDAFTGGTKTTMVGAVGAFRVASTGNHYLFLPSNADCSRLKLWFTGTASITADGVTTDLVSGEFTDVFSAVNEGGITKDYTLMLGSNSYTLTVMKSGKVGSVYIDTSNGSISSVHSSKSNSLSGTIMVVDADGNVNYDGELEKIQGRGNGTWSEASGFGKYPYNIKLMASASLLGMPKAKRWCLLSNNNDTSLVKNQLAYDFSNYIGVKYQPHCKPVDLYINQQYYGSYQLSEKVQIKSNRINVVDAYENLEIANGTLDETTQIMVPADLSTAPSVIKTENGTTSSTTTGSYAVGVRKYSTNQAGSSGGSSGGGLGGLFPGGLGGSSSGPALINPDDITGGYLYELEISQRWVDENAGFCAYNRQGWVMKSCDAATKEMVDYSYDLLYALGSSVYNNGVVPSTETTTKCPDGKFAVRTTENPAPDTKYQGKKWSEILDADSAVKYYWTQEFFKNMDSSTSSTYFYKDSNLADNMLYAGPVWDMDNSFGYDRSGERWGHSWTDPTGWYTKNARIYRFYYSDSTSTYNSDSQAPLNFYAALATNCTDFQSMVQSYWYSTIRPATRILLGEQTDPSGRLHSISYYVDTVSKSNTMNNVRLQLNGGNAYDYAAMTASMENWVETRDNWIDGEFPKVDINNATASNIPAYPCTGLEIKPNFTLTYNDSTLRKGIDYTAEYSNNIEASKNGTITITGQGLYTGTKVINFTIGSGSLVNGSADIPETAYSGDTIFVDVKNSDSNRINQFITYQWKSNGTAIAGATDKSYTVTDADKGSNITVEVSGDGVNIASVGITSNVCAVSNDEKPRGMTKTIAAWDYDYTQNPDALLTADTTGLSYYYMATSGENADTAELTASVDAQTASRIKWSGSADVYANDSTTVTPDRSPVMGTSKTDLLAWGEFPYFETTVSTLGYEDIHFSAKLGGTKKGPSTWWLQYSLDGENYTTIDGSAFTITVNKTMTKGFDNIALPAECNNKSKVYIRMAVAYDIAINAVDKIVSSLSGDAAVNNIAVVGTTTAAVTELAAPTIATTSTVGDGLSVFDSDMVTITDNNGGADIYYSVNGADAVLYQGGFNPFDKTTAVKGDSVTIEAYASFENVVSPAVSQTITFAGVNLSTFNYDDYSKNVSNGAVFSTGGIYGESGKMTAYTDGKSQYVPQWNDSKKAFCVAPDDGALWSEESGFTYEAATAGYRNITFTAKAYTTAQGPNSVSLQYSIDGEIWTTLQSDVRLNANGVLEQLFFTAALPAECENKAKIYVRLITTENKTHGDALTPSVNLHNNNSKGNLYVNDVVIAGEDDGTHKMPYTNKTTDYFGTGAILYYSPDATAMQYTVVNAASKIISAGAYPETGIVISALEGFSTATPGPYTVTIWAGDDDDKSIFNTRKYYYKGETVTEFNYSGTKRPLANYLNADGTEAKNTNGAKEGILSVYPNGEIPLAMTYDGNYGVKAGYTSANPFTAAKTLDNPDGNGYWLIKTSTKGYTDLTLNLEQISSNKAPRDWGLAYSLDGLSYTYISESNVRAISDDSSLISSVETYNNFKLPAECDNQDNLFIKIFINGGESVDGTELDLVTKGSTYIDNVELSGIAIPVIVDVTINTVALENSTDTTGTVPVDASIVVDGKLYNTTNGSVAIPMTSGVATTVYASAYGTFVNTVSVTAAEGAAVTIPVISLDVVTDGVINGKDYVWIYKKGSAVQKEFAARCFQNLINIKDENFIYTK